MKNVTDINSFENFLMKRLIIVKWLFEHFEDQYPITYFHYYE